MHKLRVAVGITEPCPHAARLKRAAIRTGGNLTIHAAAIILTGHRLVYWWKGGDKDKALLRWHDWKFEKVLEIVGDEVRTLADISNVQPSEELPPESPEPYQIAITPQGFKALKEAVGSYAKPSFRPHAVSQRRESFIDRSGSPLLQLAASELPDGSPLVFPQGTAYLRLYWSEESGEGSVRFMPTHKEAGADTVFLGDWESVPSVPHYDDDQIDIAPQLLEAWPDLEVAALQPWSGEQLGGWPFWAQGAHTLNCPECGEPMRFRFQLSSEAEALIPSLFAAEGTGQIFQCECHPERLAWIWAC